MAQMPSNWRRFESFKVDCIDTNIRLPGCACAAIYLTILWDEFKCGFWKMSHMQPPHLASSISEVLHLTSWKPYCTLYHLKKWKYLPVTYFTDSESFLKRLISPGGVQWFVVLTEWFSSSVNLYNISSSVYKDSPDNDNPAKLTL